MGKKHKINPEEDEPLSLDMTFDEALELLLNTPPPEKEDGSSMGQDTDGEEFD